jgi:hypothetical protein
VNCPASAAIMLTALQAMANGIPITPVDPTLVVSKALSLTQGTVASGSGRYDSHAIAKWEFKEGTGSIAYDTSGVDPGMDLTLSGNTGWVGGWGVSFGTNGRAQASTATSTASSCGSTRQMSRRPRPTSPATRAVTRCATSPSPRMRSSTRHSRAAAPPARTVRRR